VSLCRLGGNGNWSEPEMLRIRNYEKYDRGRQSGATMLHDGRALLLYMTPEKGGTNNDIFISFITADGTWS
jgi:hypothetical protein